jgi:hypothetical protein
MSIVVEDISIAVNLVLAVAAVVTIFFAYKTIKATQQSLEAELLNDLLKEYSTQEMLKFVRTLYDFNEQNSEVAKAYKEKYTAGNDLDLARRGVSQYYQRISKLKKANYVTELFVKTLCSGRTPELLREIVIPIEKAHAEIYKQSFNEESLQYLLRIIG